MSGLRASFPQAPCCCIEHFTEAFPLHTARGRPVSRTTGHGTPEQSYYGPAVRGFSRRRAISTL